METEWNSGSLRAVCVCVSVYVYVCVCMYVCVSAVNTNRGEATVSLLLSHRDLLGDANSLTRLLYHDTRT